MLKTKKFRRLLAGLLAVLMLSVCLPVGAFADDDAKTVDITVSYSYEEDGTVKTAGTEKITLAVGTYTIGYLVDEGMLHIPDGWKLTASFDVKISPETETLNINVERVVVEEPVTDSKVTFIYCDEADNEVGRSESTYPYHLKTEYGADKVMPVPEGYVVDDSFSFIVKEADQEILVPVKKIVDDQPTIYTVTIEREGYSDIQIQVAEGADLMTALLQDGVISNVLNDMPKGTTVTGYTYADPDHSPITEVAVYGNLTVRAVFGSNTPVTHTITIERSTGGDPIIITVEDGANIWRALRAEGVSDVILNGLPEGSEILDFTYASPEHDPIAQGDTINGDITVYCNINIPGNEGVEGYTVTIERVDTEGNVIASNVLAWAEPGEDLLQVLNMAKIDVTAGLPEGSEVVAFTYADPEESTITNVQVYGNLTVRAHISVPVDAHTVTVKRDGYSDVIFTVADGTNLRDFLWKSETQTAVLEGMPDGIGSIVDYTFDRDTGNVIDDYYVVDGDVTVRAIFPVQTHTVTILRGNFDAVQITVDNGTNLYDALWSENVQDVVLAGMPGDYSIMGYTYRAGGDDVAPTDIVLADVTVRVAFESLNTPVTHTVTVKRDGLDDVVLTVEDGANLLKALWDDATQKAVKQGMPESSSITGYTWDREIGNVIDSYYKVETDVTVRAYFSTATYAVTIEREGFDDVIINVERDTKLLEALNDESVKSVILAGLPESYTIDGFTYRDGSEIIDQDIVLADVTVKAVLNQYYTVTIERSNGAPSILVAVKRGDKLLETLNSDDTMAKVMDGCDGYKVTSFTYRDGSEIIDQDIVLVNMTVRANMEAVPAEPSDPSTGDNTTTVTGKDEHPDIAEAKANGTWGAAPTAAPVAAATNTIPQTSDDMPVTMLIVIALVAAGAAGGLVVLRKRSHQ